MYADLQAGVSYGGGVHETRTDRSVRFAGPVVDAALGGAIRPWFAVAGEIGLGLPLSSMAIDGQTVGSTPHARTGLRFECVIDTVFLRFATGVQRTSFLVTAGTDVLEIDAQGMPIQRTKPQAVTGPYFAATLGVRPWGRVGLFGRAEIARLRNRTTTFTPNTYVFGVDVAWF